mmetsp:Transcript_33333/g.75259  ORF Transcript_33333/g.75259 Transcript_33333/m.75259 type:complete len:260 (+) Transcript_33333:742-1521(+)
MDWLRRSSAIKKSTFMRPSDRTPREAGSSLAFSAAIAETSAAPRSAAFFAGVPAGPRSSSSSSSSFSCSSSPASPPRSSFSSPPSSSSSSLPPTSSISPAVRCAACSTLASIRAAHSLASASWAALASRAALASARAAARASSVASGSAGSDDAEDWSQRASAGGAFAMAGAVSLAKLEFMVTQRLPYAIATATNMKKVQRSGVKRPLFRWGPRVRRPDRIFIEPHCTNSLRYISFNSAKHMKTVTLRCLPGSSFLLVF